MNEWTLFHWCYVELEQGKHSISRKKTVDIDILVTSRNGDRKIMQSIRITKIT